MSDLTLTPEQVEAIQRYREAGKNKTGVGQFGSMEQWKEMDHCIDLGIPCDLLYAIDLEEAETQSVLPS